MCNNHDARSNVKVTVCTDTLCIGISETCSCPGHNYALSGGGSKLFSTNDYHDKKVHQRQRPYCKVKGQGCSLLLTFVHKLQ